MYPDDKVRSLVVHLKCPPFASWVDLWVDWILATLSYLGLVALV